MNLTISELARVMGGDIVGNQVLCPGPGHRAEDRSLSVKLDATARDGFVVHTFSRRDDFLTCKDYVRARLGLNQCFPHEGRRQATKEADPPRSSERARRERAVSIWRESRDPKGSIVEAYLRSRGIIPPPDLSNDVLRFHPQCPWRDERTGEIVRTPAMIAAMRCIHTNRLMAVHRTALTSEGMKIGRRMLGTAARAAIKLDPDDGVTTGLIIGEGVETCLAARQFGFGPVWALGSVGAIAEFPVLDGVEALTCLVETDDNGASERALEQCGSRWLVAHREVLTITPTLRGDVNDALMEILR